MDRASDVEELSSECSCTDVLLLGLGEAQKHSLSATDRFPSHKSFAAERSSPAHKSFAAELSSPAHKSFAAERSSPAWRG